MEILNLDFNPANPESSFDRIAMGLMNQWYIQVHTSSYRICEIEFYLTGPDHNDPYTHGHEHQLTSGRWYFHPSGLDITFGDKNYFGGILLRSILDRSTGDYTYGPIKTVTRIFRNLPSIFNSDLVFYLKKDIQENLSIEKVIKAPRVNLNPYKDPKYAKKYYRYLIFPKRRHAEKGKIAEAMKGQGFKSEEIDNIWG